MKLQGRSWTADQGGNFFEISPLQTIINGLRVHWQVSIAGGKKSTTRGHCPLGYGALTYAKCNDNEQWAVRPLNLALGVSHRDVRLWKQNIHNYEWLFKFKKISQAFGVLWRFSKLPKYNYLKIGSEQELSRKYYFSNFWNQFWKKLFPTCTVFSWHFGNHKKVLEISFSVFGK